MYFRIILLLLLTHSFSILNAETDILKANIIRHNKLKTTDKTIQKIDSSKIFRDLNFLNNESNKKYSVQILRKRIQNTNINYFFYILGILLVVSIMRYTSKLNFKYQVSEFIKFKFKNISEYSFIQSIIINIIFALIISHIIYVFSIKSNYIEQSPQRVNQFIFISICIIMFLFFKYMINFFIIKIFNLKNKIIKLKFVWIDFMYIFLSISLPLILISTLVIPSLQNLIIISISTILIVMYFFMLIKIYSININLLTNHILKFIIYFYTVEIIPILLLLKYLKTFSV